MRRCATVTSLNRCGGGGLSPGPEQSVLLSGSLLMQIGSEVYTLESNSGGV